MLSDRKKALINWVDNKAKEDGVFLPPVLLQKFLFFYECFSKAEGDEYSFEELKGYKRGPVFGDVYRELKYNQTALDAYVKESTYNLNEDRAKMAFFAVRILGNTLSDFTHIFDIWKAKEADIQRGEYQVPLSDCGFSEKDAEIISDMQSMYPISLIDSVKVIVINGKAFLFPKDEEIKERHYDVLYEASMDSAFHTPVYVEVEGEGLILE